MQIVQTDDEKKKENKPQLSDFTSSFRWETE